MRIQILKTKKKKKKKKKRRKTLNLCRNFNYVKPDDDDKISQ